jgi:hypothetical protein
MKFVNLTYVQRNVQTDEIEYEMESDFRTDLIGCIEPEAEPGFTRIALTAAIPLVGSIHPEQRIEVVGTPDEIKRILENY